ncbi:MAG: LacI family DNA-binding transcriptional regulator [Clostridia bacterium]|nr:LacI family DNA-binding transcriptional regulator [Clostridia bacterium]
MKHKSVSMSDIAQALGVSKNAVSLALRGRSGVSEALRRQIVEKAREMDYAGSGGSSCCILALIPQRIALLGEGMFFQRLCLQLNTCARAKDAILVCVNITEQEEASLVFKPMLNLGTFQGVMTIGNLSREYCRKISECGLRYVAVDHSYSDLPVDSVTTANESGAYCLTKHLIECGHRRIQFIGRPSRTASLFERWVGFQHAMSEAGLPIFHNLMTEAVSHEHDSESEYPLVVRALEAMPELPTAFVCGHDLTAKNVVGALARRGLRCPEDFSIVGFDDIQQPDLLPLELTTYRTPVSQIAETSVELLLGPRHAAPQKIELFGEIVRRSSVKPLA